MCSPVLPERVEDHAYVVVKRGPVLRGKGPAVGAGQQEDAGVALAARRRGKEAQSHVRRRGKARAKGLVPRGGQCISDNIAFRGPCQCLLGI